MDLQGSAAHFLDSKNESTKESFERGKGTQKNVTCLKGCYRHVHVLMIVMFLGKSCIQWFAIAF